MNTPSDGRRRFLVRYYAEKFDELQGGSLSAEARWELIRNPAFHIGTEGLDSSELHPSGDFLDALKNGVLSNGSYLSDTFASLITQLCESKPTEIALPYYEKELELWYKVLECLTHDLEQRDPRLPTLSDCLNDLQQAQRNAQTFNLSAPEGFGSEEDEVELPDTDEYFPLK